MFSVEEAGLLCAFESHTGIVLDQFVLRRRIERALDLLKNSNAGDPEMRCVSGLERHAPSGPFSPSA
jgi:hypothetical protein